MKIALVTCLQMPEPDVDEQLLLKTCLNSGFDAKVVPWDDPSVSWSDFNICLVRSTWNYHLDVETFRHWLVRTAKVSHLLNPLDLMLGNTHKSYLKEVETQGIPIVPTEFVQKGAAGFPFKKAAENEWENIVIKPAVSGSSYRTYHITDIHDPEARELAFMILGDEDMMIQPYVKSVENKGEIAMVCIGGEFSHTIMKNPRFNDDDESVELIDPPKEALEITQQVINNYCQNTVYARVDLMRMNEKWVLSELELIEPSLFLSHQEGSAEKLVDCLKEVQVHV